MKIFCKVVLVIFFVQQISFASQVQEGQNWHDRLSEAATFEEYKNIRNLIDAAIIQNQSAFKIERAENREQAGVQQHLIAILIDINDMKLPVPTDYQICKMFDGGMSESNLTQSAVRELMGNAKVYVNSVIPRGTSSLQDVSLEDLRDFVDAYIDIKNMELWLKDNGALAKG